MAFRQRARREFNGRSPAVVGQPCRFAIIHQTSAEKARERNLFTGPRPSIRIDNFHFQRLLERNCEMCGLAVTCNLSEAPRRSPARGCNTGVDVTERPRGDSRRLLINRDGKLTGRQRVEDASLLAR